MFKPYFQKMQVLLGRWIIGLDPKKGRYIICLNHPKGNCFKKVLFLLFLLVGQQQPKNEQHNNTNMLFFLDFPVLIFHVVILSFFLSMFTLASC